MLWILIVALTALAAWGCAQLFQPRAAFLQVGAMIGTIMAGNVFFNIIPAHWELINAKKAGREPDPIPGIVAKQRSVHNNYFTLPVLFTMIAGHFAFTYGAERAWLVLLVIMFVGILSRVFFNLRHQGRTIWAIPAVGAVVLVLLGVAIRPDDDAAGAGAATVSFAEVAPVVEQRCAPCHSQAPTQPGFSSPPAGVVLETPEQIAARADDIERVVSSKAMPLGNLTGMTTRTRPRRRLGHQGASTESRSTMLRITAGGFSFTARLEEEDAPETVAAFRRLLPLESRIIHVAGAARRLDPVRRPRPRLGPENARATRTRARSSLPGGVSETEILLAYGYVNFASKAGQLAGNHFATIIEGNENLRRWEEFLWEGAQEIVFSEVGGGEMRAPPRRASPPRRSRAHGSGRPRSPRRGAAARRPPSGPRRRSPRSAR